MCSIMLLVVQSTMVVPSRVRGSAPRPTTISLVRARSWACAVDDRARASVTDSTRSRVTPRMEASGGSDSELRIEGVAEPVAEQVDAERGEGEGQAGERHEPPRHVEEVAALRQHAAPRRGGRLHAEAEIA